MKSKSLRSNDIALIGLAVPDISRPLAKPRTLVTELTECNTIPVLMRLLALGVLGASNGSHCFDFHDRLICVCNIYIERYTYSF